MPVQHDSARMPKCQYSSVEGRLGNALELGLAPEFCNRYGRTAIHVRLDRPHRVEQLSEPNLPLLRFGLPVFSRGGFGHAYRFATRLLSRRDAAVSRLGVQ